MFKGLRRSKKEERAETEVVAAPEAASDDKDAPDGLATMLGGLLRSKKGEQQSGGEETEPKEEEKAAPEEASEDGDKPEAASDDKDAPDGLATMLGGLLRSKKGEQQSGGEEAEPKEEASDEGPSLWSYASAAAAAAWKASPPDEPESVEVILGEFDFEDGYRYPNLFGEADEMLLVSMLMYTMTDLRAMAKQQNLRHDPDRILQLPITLRAALGCIEDNLDQLLQEEAGHEMALTALKSIQERYDGSLPESTAPVPTGGGWFNPFQFINATKTTSESPLTLPEPATLTAFGDDKPDKELVYAVGIDPSRKRITVAFRGSVTPSDFITDACIEFNYRKNPIDEGGQNIGIHHGFDQYLLNRKLGNDSCKYDEIMAHVRALFAAGKGRMEEYKLYVTGHSLGGALASLFAFEAAAAARGIPTPVTCVSLASPRVGDLAFQRAFGELERRGLLRHLRVAHAQDPITMMPKTDSRRTLAVLSPISLLGLTVRDALTASQVAYRHTGVKLRLLSTAEPPNGYELSYAGVTTALDEFGNDEPTSAAQKAAKSWVDSLKRLTTFSGIPGVKYHFGNTYTERLAAAKDELSEMTLNQLYRKLGPISSK